MDDKVTTPEPVIHPSAVSKIPETSVDIQHVIERVIPVVEQASQTLEAPEVNEQTMRTAEVVQTQATELTDQVHRINEAMQRQIIATEVEVTQAAGQNETLDTVEVQEAETIAIEIAPAPVQTMQAEQSYAETYEEPEPNAPQPQKVTNTARQTLDNFIHPHFELETEEPDAAAEVAPEPTIQEIEDSLRATAPLVAEDWETSFLKPPEDSEATLDQNFAVEPEQVTAEADVAELSMDAGAQVDVIPQPEVRKISVVDLDAEPATGAQTEQQVQQEVVKNLETFVAFVRNIHEFESELTQGKTEIVHAKIEQINELTAQLQEAEIVDSDKHVEKTKENLKAAFIELFAEAGMQIDENKTRHLVNAWIEQDVLRSDLFKTLESELYKDDGMHEIVQRFLAALHVVHQTLLETHDKIGRFVVANLHRPELARELVVN